MPRTTAGIGLDGCRGGWIAATAHASGAVELTLLSRIEALEAMLAAFGPRPPTTLIDIPIGLPLVGERPIDVEARAALGRAASSVFTVPPRPVFDALDFSEAQALARGAMGKGFSIQAWNILPKIREVDLWLRRRGGTPPIREAHPELAFRGLARLVDSGGVEFENKKTAAGQHQRKSILEALGVDIAGVGPLKAGAVTAGTDDVLDAMALAALARSPAHERGTLPQRSTVDPFGFPMEMVVPRILIGK